MDTEQKCVIFVRVERAQLITDELVQMHSEHADKKRTRYGQIVKHTRYLREFI